MEKKELGARIKRFREERKITRNALANISGVSPTYIYQLEQGLKSPTVEYLDLICWGLGITIEEFFRTEQTAPDVESLTAKQRELLNQFLKSL